MKFLLQCSVGYSVGSCHDDRSLNFDQEFGAPSIKAGIAKARDIVREKHEHHKVKTDYTLGARLFVVEPIWHTHWEPAESGHPAVPARLATSARFKDRVIRRSLRA